MWIGVKEKKKVSWEETQKCTLGEDIFNLRGETLEKEAFKVFDKMLKYSPVKNVNKFQTYINVHKYVCILNIKKIFYVKFHSPKK